MAIELDNLGVSIRITNGTSIREVMKLHIIEVDIIKTNIIKIDIGAGALKNIFLPFSQVTHPVVGDIEVLITMLRDWISSAGLATGAGQLNIAGAVSTVYGAVLHSTQELIKLNDKRLNAPLAIDDLGNGTIYKGFAYIGTEVYEPSWAIQKIQTIGTQTIVKWAEGLTSPSFAWDSRESLTYY